jgi:lipopolysaccharide biosynthesis protein
MKIFGSTKISHSQGGAIDHRIAGSLSGWAYSPEWKQSTIPRIIHIFIDNHAVSSIEVSIYREDVMSAGYGDGQLGFHVTIPRLQEYQENAGIIASFSANIADKSAHFHNSTLQAIPELEGKKTTSLVAGSIDERGWGTISGWALLKERPFGEAIHPNIIHLFLEGKQVASTTVNRLRKDLLEKGIGDGANGYIFAVSPDQMTQLNKEVVISFSKDFDKDEFKAGSMTLSEIPFREHDPREIHREAFEFKIGKRDHEHLDALLKRLFQVDYFLRQTNNTPAPENPLAYYLETGWQLGLNPHPNLEVKHYSQHLKGVEPFQHYVARGWALGFDPTPEFSTKRFLKTHPKMHGGGGILGYNWLSHTTPFDAETDYTNPLGALVSKKEKAMLRACFNKHYYLRNNPDVQNFSKSAFAHFVLNGWREDRDPSPFFSIAYYMKQVPSCLAEGINPVLHYLRIGWKQGLNPSERFHTQRILKEFPKAREFPGGPLPYVMRHIKRIERLESKPGVSFFGKNHHRTLTSRTTPPAGADLIHTIAYYLPQFHPIAENEKTWGPGFTEWTNVTKARPEFIGHHQPMLPGELGFYDLRVAEIMERQIELAKLYGLHGWCFYYYWFSGKRLLEKPLNMFLSNSDRFDFPFMVMWTNENWTKRWDGAEHDVIIKQDHRKDDPLRFIQDVETTLLDPRYIRIDEKPVLGVYKIDLIPDFHSMVKTWRNYWREKHGGELYLLFTNTSKISDPTEIDCDAIVQFPPNGVALQRRPHMPDFFRKDLQGCAFSYDEVAEVSCSIEATTFPFFRCSFPAWDNTARRPKGGDMFIGSDPDKFRNWTISNIRHTLNAHLGDERLVFINAWNEWAEGAALEPNLLEGYANLGAVSDAISAEHCRLEFANKERQKDRAVVLHLFHTDLLPLFQRYLEPYLPFVDIFITAPLEGFADRYVAIKKAFPDANVLAVKNQGRDLAPFLSAMRYLGNLGYLSILKIHSKKSTHRSDGSAWLHDILSKLLPANTPETFISEMLEQKNTGLIGPARHVICGREYLGSNLPNMRDLAQTLGVDNELLTAPYFAGTMFWFCPEALQKLWAPEFKPNFEQESGQIDGTIAHALERLLPSIALASRFMVRDTDGLNLGTRVSNKYLFGSENQVLFDREVFSDHHLAFLHYDGEHYATDKPRKEYLHLLAKHDKLAIVAMFFHGEGGLMFRKHLLKKLRQDGFGVICVNPALATAERWFPLSGEADLSIARCNKGYDFSSWLLGVRTLTDLLPHTEQLLLINDSCYGPIGDIPWDSLPDADVVSLTEGKQFTPHMQSNFLLLKNLANCLEARLLEEFADRYKGEGDKMQIVFDGEIGFSNLIRELGLQWKPMFPYDDIATVACQKWASSKDTWEEAVISAIRKDHVNPLHYFHKILIEDYNYPFLKRDLVRNNPSDDTGLDIFVDKLTMAGVPISEFIEDDEAYSRTSGTNGEKDDHLPNP